MNAKLKTEPNIVLRKEFDDWTILFDPDTGKTCGISPTGVFIWKQLDGSKSKADILQAMAVVYGEDIQEEAAGDYDEFIKQLCENGLLVT